MLQCNHILIKNKMNTWDEFYLYHSIMKMNEQWEITSVWTDLKYIIFSKLNSYKRTQYNSILYSSTISKTKNILVMSIGIGSKTIRKTRQNSGWWLLWGVTDCKINKRPTEGSQITCYVFLLSWKVGTWAFIFDNLLSSTSFSITYFLPRKFKLQRETNTKNTAAALWWHALPSLDTLRNSIIVHHSFCLKVNSRREIIVSPLSETEKLESAGKTQVFNDAKRCSIFPSFNPREWCFHLPHFIPLRCTFKKKCILK